MQQRREVEPPGLERQRHGAALHEVTPVTPAIRLSVSAAATNSGVRSTPQASAPCWTASVRDRAADAAADVERPRAGRDVELREQRLGRLPAAEMQRLDRLQVLGPQRLRVDAVGAQRREHPRQRPAARVVRSDIGLDWSTVAPTSASLSATSRG